MDLIVVEDELNKPIDGSHFFSWKDALYLPTWQVCVIPKERQRENIIKMSHKLDLINYLLGAKIKVTSWLRPTLYNQAIGGAKKSMHLDGRAVDFILPHVSADAVREILLPYLEELGLRMENLPRSRWVHVDDKKTENRYFKP